MTPETIALKRATVDMIRGVGGLEVAAQFCRVGKSVLGDNQSINKPDSFVAIDVVAALEPLARERDGWPHITRALAGEMGFLLFKRPDAVPDKTDLLTLVGQLSQRNGEVAGEVCTSLADGVVDYAEARRTRARLAMQIAIALELDAALAAIEDKGGKA